VSQRIREADKAGVFGRMSILYWRKLKKIRRKRP